MTLLCIKYFRTWKFQADKRPTFSEQWECTKQVLISHFAIALPSMHVFHHSVWCFVGLMEGCCRSGYYIRQRLGMSAFHVSFPSI